MRLISGIGSCISGNAVSVFRQSNHFQNRPGSAVALPATTHLFSGNQTISRTVRFVASTVQQKPDQTWQRVISGIGCAVAGNVSATIYPRHWHRHHFRHGHRQAGKVAKRAFNKAGGWVPKVGDLVSISVHRVDSSKLSPTNIVGVIVEFTTGGLHFRVWTKSGLLKTNYTAGNVSRCKSTAVAMGLESAISDASVILRLPASERGNRSISESERAAIKA